MIANEPKALTGSNQKVRSQVFHPDLGTHGQKRLPVYRQGLTHPCHFNQTLQTRHPASMRQASPRGALWG